MKMKLSLPELRRLAALTDRVEDRKLHYRLLNTLKHVEDLQFARERRAEYRKVAREELPRWQLA